MRIHPPRRKKETKPAPLATKDIIILTLQSVALGLILASFTWWLRIPTYAIGFTLGAYIALKTHKEGK